MTKILNATIAVVAPSKASAIDHPEILVEMFEQFGIKTNIPNDLSVDNADPICANTLKERTKFLVNAINDPDVKLIWSIRGGYGAMELIPELDKYDFSNKTKILIGFSDMTALFLYFIKKYNWICLHAPVLSHYINKQFPLSSDNPLIALLTGTKTAFSYSLLPLNFAARQNTTIKGKIIGGNLTLVQCSLGTKWQIDSTNQILFLEEVNEEPYRVRRSLVHLQQAGILKNLKAILLGQILFEEKDQLLGKQTLEQFFAESSIPVYQLLNIGHDKINDPLFLGTETTIQGGPNPSISFNNYLYKI